MGHHQHKIMFVVVGIVACFLSACVEDDGECLDPEGFQGEHGCVYPDELAVEDEDDWKSLELASQLEAGENVSVAYSADELARRQRYLVDPAVFSVRILAPELAEARFQSERVAFERCGMGVEPVLQDEMKLERLERGGLYVERYYFCERPSVPLDDRVIVDPVVNPVIPSR